MKQADWNPEREEMSVADYKRMVSYMYQYENGVKKKNVGFARVEAKDGQCKITLHMQLLGQLDSIFPTYILQRKHSDLELIYLGDTVLKNQVMDSKLVTEESNVMKSGYPLADMGGLLLFLNDNIFFATEWDDKPILASEVLEALKPKTKREPKLTLEEELLIPKYKLPRGYKIIERLQKPGSYLMAEETKNSRKLDTLNESLPQDSKEESEVIDLAGATEETTPLEAASISSEVEQKEVTDQEGYDDQSENTDPQDMIEAEEVLSTLEEFLIHGSDQDVQDETVAGGPTDFNGTSEVIKGCETEDAMREGAQEMADPQVASVIFEKYPRIYPFEDNEILICVKIEPKDIGLLPKELWALSNNSFLVHGYYCYHHLIFAKMKDGSGCRYILGVPGIYHNRERFMAKMFGFDGFKPIRKRELRQGDFGYWYTSVCF
jgi:hypothetical protein